MYANFYKPYYAFAILLLANTAFSMQLFNCYGPIINGVDRNGYFRSLSNWFNSNSNLNSTSPLTTSSISSISYCFIDSSSLNYNYNMTVRVSFPYKGPNFTKGVRMSYLLTMYYFVFDFFLSTIISILFNIKGRYLSTQFNLFRRLSIHYV